MSKDIYLVLLIVIVTFISRCGVFIESPILLDSYLLFSTNQTISNKIDQTNSQAISVIFVLIGQFTITCCILGLALIYNIIYNRETILPVKQVLLNYNVIPAGLLCGCYNLMVTFARSGQHTPPYMHGILGSFVVPFQFIARYFMINKKPTILKFFCVIAILIAEVICLLPAIIPGFESESARKDDGGATGLGAWLWPLCMVFSMLPFAIGNVLVETAAHKCTRNNQNELVPELNLIQYLFFWTLIAIICMVTLFWTDCIPGFGTSNSFEEFFSRYANNVLCLFNRNDCPSAVRLLSCFNFALKFGVLFSFPFLLRKTEGASFLVILMTLRTPMVLLFWSLFDEEPFYWHPHVHLGTWLSIAAVCIIFPAVVLYSNGDKWLEMRRNKRKVSSYSEETRLLDGHHEHTR